jgi:hypothetical protein
MPELGGGDRGAPAGVRDLDLSILNSPLSATPGRGAPRTVAAEDRGHLACGWSEGMKWQVPLRTDRTVYSPGPVREPYRPARTGGYLAGCSLGDEAIPRPFLGNSVESRWHLLRRS